MRPPSTWTGLCHPLDGQSSCGETLRQSAWVAQTTDVDQEFQKPGDQGISKASLLCTSPCGCPSGHPCVLLSSSPEVTSPITLGPLNDLIKAQPPQEGTPFSL